MAYTLTGEKCGTVRFEASRNGTINGETFTHSSKVTQNPIEGGANINDHVFRNPAGLQSCSRYEYVGYSIGWSKDHFIDEYFNVRLHAVCKSLQQQAVQQQWSGHTTDTKLFRD